MINCPCSGKHVPKPLTGVEVEGYTLCPTAHANLEDLLAMYKLTGGRPDGSVTKHYGKFIRDLAEKIWESNL
jgi:hypothetical protein